MIIEKSKLREALAEVMMGDAWERMFDRLEARREAENPTTQARCDQLRREAYYELADEIIFHLELK